MKLNIYVDGSCFGNNLLQQTKGGFGVYINLKNYLLGYSNCGTTNNQMEIWGVLFALLYASKYDENSLILSDSAYVVNAYNSWMLNWAKANWRKSDKSPVLNEKFWKFLLEIRQKYPRIKLEQIPRERNKQADRLARLGSEKAEKTDSKGEFIFLEYKAKVYQFEQHDLQEISENFLSII